LDEHAVGEIKATSGIVCARTWFGKGGRAFTKVPLVSDSSGRIRTAVNCESLSQGSLRCSKLSRSELKSPIHHL